MDRFYIDAHGADDDAVAHGFAWLIETCQKLSSRGAVVTPGVNQLESLGSAIGGTAAAALKKDRQVQVQGGVVIEAYSDKTLPFSFDGPILGVWVDDKEMLKLEALRPAALLAIPWNRANLDSWKSNFAPVDWRTGEPASGAAPMDPVAAEAIRSLSDSVNLSSGFHHPMDKPKAVWTFKLLKKAGIDFTSQGVEAAAVQSGWEPRHAAELSEMAQKILDGRTVQGGKNPWAADIVEQWRSRA